VAKFKTYHDVKGYLQEGLARLDEEGNLVKEHPDGVLIKQIPGLGFGFFLPGNPAMPLILWSATNKITLHTNCDLSVANRRFITELTPIPIEVQGGVWVINTYHPYTVGFMDGCVITLDNASRVYTVRGGVDAAHIPQLQKERKRIGTFASNLVHAFRKGRLEAPGKSECGFCAIKMPDGSTAGEYSRNNSHLKNHVQMMQYGQVPELLLRALEVAEDRDTFRALLNKVWTNGDAAGVPAQDDGVWSVMARDVRRYLCKQLGFAYS
jgi:hypothetical protein